MKKIRFLFFNSIGNIRILRLLSLCCRLIYAGKQLADDKTAKEYSIEGW
jgi:hypothetical protein